MKVTTQPLSVKIREARDAAGLTQEDLAREIGVTLRAVQAWELTDRAPRSKYVRALARVTDRPVEFFIPEEEEAA